MEKVLAWLQTHQFLTLGSFSVSFLMALALTPVVIRMAHARGLVAKPRLERWHKNPTALFGGVAIFLATLVGWALFLPSGPGVLALTVGSALLFFSGLYDDLRELRPAQKVVPQFVLACVFAALFYKQVPPPVAWLVPLAIVWIVGITNAINLLDNMDGLSAGVSMLCALLMAAHAAWSGDTGVAAGALVVAGAAGGFLVFNFNPAKIFMGDCGSMFLGFSLACLSLMGQSAVLSENLFTALLLPTLVLATPLFDTFFVAVVRFLNGRPIALGGRDHTSHRLVLLGLSERRAVLWLYGITLWFGVIALWGAIAHNWVATLTVTAFSWGALLVLGIVLAEVQTYSPEECEAYREIRERRDTRVVLSRVIRYKRRLAEALLDFGSICACWFAAFLLRYDGALGSHVREMGTSLPYVIAIQLSALYGCGLYKHLWRYVTITDLEAIVRGVLLGSFGLFVVLNYVVGIRGLSTSVVIMDSLLLLLSVSGMRLGLKALRFHFALKWREGMRRVLVFGAGDTGELAVREMLSNRELQLQPVGFIDDDPDKQRVTIHGVRVLGTSEELLELIERHRIDEVIVALSPHKIEAAREIVGFCQGQGIMYRELRGLIV